MKRFALTAAVALVIGLGTAATADAQYAARRYNVTPYGVVTTDQFYNYGAYRANQTLASPFGGFAQRAYYGDVFGNTYGQSYGYNPFFGSTYGRSFGYSPFYGTGYNTGFRASPFNPAGNYSYGFYRNW